MDNWWKKTKEERQEEYRRINQEIKIMDYAVRLGFQLKKVGSYYTLVEHDSVRIHPEKNIFVRNSRFSHEKGHAGGIIDFALEFSGKDKREVLKELSEMLSLTDILEGPAPAARLKKKEEKKEEKESLILPKRASGIKNVYAYLVQTRKIDRKLVSEMIHNKNLYQDERNNCVFVSYKNDEPVYACLRGTNVYKPFKGDVSGCNYQEGYFIDYQATTTIVAEGVIDLLSIMTLLLKEEKSYTEYNYLALGSANKYLAVLHHMQEDKKVKSYVIALDNDEAGHKFTNLIIEKGREADPECRFRIWQSKEKDWNEELTKKE